MTPNDEHTTPPDALCLLPTYAAVGHGYIAETTDDAVILMLFGDPNIGPVNIAIPPDLADLIGRQLTEQVTRLRRLTTPNTEGHDDD